MNDDSSDALIGLVLIVALVCGGFIVWGIWELLKYIVDHPEETERFLKNLFWIVTAPLWLPPVAIARIILFFVRDIPVYILHASSTTDPRDMVAFWVAVVPLAIGATLGIALVYLRLQDPNFIYRPVTWYVMLFFLLLEGCYYFLYFMRPLHHHNWPIYIAAEEDILFDIRSSLAVRRYDIRLWFLAHWRAIQHVLKGKVKTEMEQNDGTSLG